jgi:hypothetical protein
MEWLKSFEDGKKIAVGVVKEGKEGSKGGIDRFY